MTNVERALMGRRQPKSKDLRLAERGSIVRMYQTDEYEQIISRALPDGSVVLVWSKCIADPRLPQAFYGVAFAGTAGKHSGHVIFKTREQAETWAEGFLRGRAQHLAFRAEMSEQLKARRYWGA